MKSSCQTKAYSSVREKKGSKALRLRGHLAGLGTGSKSNFCRFVAHEILEGGREAAADMEEERKGGRQTGTREEPRNAGGQKSGHISSASTAVITDHSLTCKGKMSSGC